MLPVVSDQIPEGVKTLWGYVRKDKPKVLRKDFAFKEPLSRGWMLPYLIRLDDLTWQRWEHWSRIMFAGEINGDVIPPIVWVGEERNGPGRKMLERSLSAITNCGDWAGWSSWTYFDFLLDWLLFGLGHSMQKEEPKAPHGCEAASERLYQIFNLEPLLAFPHDYFGDILAENNFGRHSGFFPTPMHLCEMMTRCTFGEGIDYRTKTVCDPCVGTGRMLLCASNHSYRLYGQDINQTVIKAALVNGYLYAPWMVKPFEFLDTMKTTQPQYELPEAETAFNLAGEKSEDPQRIAVEIQNDKANQKEAREIEKRAQLELI